MSTPPLEWTLCHLYHHVHLSFLDCDIWSIFLLCTWCPQLSQLTWKYLEESSNPWISVPSALT
jgi:hypothetical protein